MAFKLSKRAARVVHINRRREKHGDEESVVAVDIGLDVALNHEEMAQLVKVSEGAPLAFIESLFDSTGNKRCLNMKALQLEDVGSASLVIYIDTEDLAFNSEIKKAKIEIGESLHGGRLLFQVAYEPDENDAQEAALLLYMPIEVMLSVKPGPQKELELPAGKGKTKGDGDDARTH